MTIFSETIFPPIPKVVRESPIRNNDYWYKYTMDDTLLMVRCPICSKVYEYMKLRKVAVHELNAAIADNPKFYREEWARTCPDFSVHYEKTNLMKGYV